MKKIKAGIIGGAGYTGGELLRLLLGHPQVELGFVHSRTQAGLPVHTVHQDLLGSTDICFAGSIDLPIDVLFLCLAQGESDTFLRENEIPDSVRIIDLTHDFRLKEHAKLGSRAFIYGLPELNRAAIQSAKNIANPGCFATAIQLGLMPLANTGELKDVYTTGITGSTGAGQSFIQSSHFSWRAHNIQAYKTLSHQHVGEIKESLASLSGQEAPSVHFVPWRGDFTRGIFVSSTVRTSRPLVELQTLYQDFYQAAPFVHLSQESIFLKQVVGTNKALIQLEKQGDVLVVHSIIDNLLKGASGQALQNMNLMFGFEETAGLQLKANYF